jgi:ATP/maltotriose-dependent transcriptional regulator MalT
MGNRRYAAIATAALGGIERRIGDLDEADRSIAEAERDLHALGDRLYAAINHAARGHVALARGEEARSFLESAKRVARELEAGGESEIGMAIRALEEAIAARDAGERLYRGERIEELPEPLRRWLEERGRL